MLKRLRLYRAAGVGAGGDQEESVILGGEVTGRSLLVTSCYQDVLIPYPHDIVIRYSAHDKSMADTVYAAIESQRSRWHSSQEDHTE